MYPTHPFGKVYYCALHSYDMLMHNKKAAP